MSLASQLQAGFTRVAEEINAVREEMSPPIASAQAYSSTGLTGAVAGGRFVGATASGPPITGTFVVGDFAVDHEGVLWICTASGSPGTWVDSPSSGRTLDEATSTVTQSGLTGTNDITSLSIDFDVTTRPVLVTLHVAYIVAASVAANAQPLIRDASNNIKAMSSIYLAINGVGSAEAYETLYTPGSYTRKGSIFRSGAGGGTLTVNQDLAYVVSWIRAVTI